MRSELTDEQISKLCRIYWSRWEAGIEIGEDKAIGALQRLDEKVWTDMIREAREQGLEVKLLAAQLSPREREVLQLMAHVGKTKTIATYLGIGEQTVKHYRRRILLKLGAQTGTHAVALGLRTGTIR